MKNVNTEGTQTGILETSETKSVLILGATGAFGSELTRQMASKGWQVKALTRQPRDHKESDHQIDWVTGDLDRPETLFDAAKNVDMIVHAVNVPYQHWHTTMVNYTRTIIDLAQRNDAHLMFVGNVYNAGIPADGIITENTPNAPVNEKGEIRAQLEGMIKQASGNGLRTTTVRFGDFFGPGAGTSSWLNVCMKAIGKNKLMFAGDADMPHTWAYLPDAAKAFEQVAARRLTEFNSPSHLVLPFSGHVFTFMQLRDVIESIKGRTVKVNQTPWTLFKVLGLVIPLLREIVSMRYLWQHDIRMDGSALEHYLGEEPEHTALHQAVLTSFPELADDAPNKLAKVAEPA